MRSASVTSIPFFITNFSFLLRSVGHTSVRGTFWAAFRFFLQIQVAWGCIGSGSAITFASDSPTRIDPAGIRGALVICGGGRFPAAARNEFLKLAGGEKARLVIIPTALGSSSEFTEEKVLSSWKSEKYESLKLLHADSRDLATNSEFSAPLKEATGVWFEGGSQSRISERYLNTQVESELKNLIDRGGVIGGTSAGAAVMSRTMIASGNPVAEVRVGFDFLPGCVIDQHFHERSRVQRLEQVIAQRPNLFGMGIDEGTAVIVKGREMSVVGENSVTILLAAGGGRPARQVEFREDETTDLTRWRRAALVRTQLPTVVREPNSIEVSQGSLLIVGGGGMPKVITEKFIELAGGPDAKIIVLPTANPDPLPMRDGRFFERAGCKNVKVLPERTYQEVSSPEFLEEVKQARGVWFGGGRQWRFVDAYENTAALEAFRDVLRRGGVIGGSSAGATIQGELLVRGSPQGNMEMMAEGYEQGFAFLPGTAIDQHFSQRKRLPDLVKVVQTHRKLLGIGLDESTAIVVRKDHADVIGEHEVRFLSMPENQDASEPEIVVLKSGGKFDLVRRLTVEEPKAESN